MKSALVASLGLCTLAAATNHRHPHFNYRRQNETTEPVTTLTVLTTQLHTVLSCAASITNCPVDAAGISSLAAVTPGAVETVQITDVIQLYTTICPVTAAESVTSSVYSAAATGAITGVTLTATTTAPTAAATSDVSAEEGNPPYSARPSGSGLAPFPTAGPSGVTSVSPYPTGTSSGGDDDDDTCEDEDSTTVIQTTVQQTTQVPVTITVTETGASGELTTKVTTALSTQVTAVPVTSYLPEPQPGDDETTTEGTSTVTRYSTGTRTATLTSVQSIYPTEVSVSGNSASGTTPEDSGSDTCTCEPPITVTVTEPPKTVYVTVAPGASTAPAVSDVPTTTLSSALAAATDADDDTCDDDGEVTDNSATPTDAGDDDTCVEETVTATIVPTATRAPNATAPYPTGYAALKNRFAKVH
ncbi:unnamed protein product [Discula destructiva]